MADRVIIVGAGQAGAQAAISLRQGGYRGDVLLTGREPHLPYQRPPLSKQILKREWPAERCQLRHLQFYAEHGIELWSGVTAVGLDPARGTVAFDDLTERGYDAAIICSGSAPIRLHVPGAEFDGVLYLRTIDQALVLAERLQQGTRVAVIGGGFIGLEVAAAARGLGCEVTVVEALDQLMKRSTLPEVAAWLQRRHLAEGVVFRLGRKLIAVRGSGRVEGVELDDGEVIPAEIVMVGIGVRPELRWLEGSGVLVERGVRVDETGRTSVANVFAAGDVAELRHPLLDGWQLLESVQNAVSQGRQAAAAILGKDERYTEVPWFWSEQYDCRLQMAGIPRRGDSLVLREHPDSGGLSVFSLDSGSRLHAVQSINSPRDYMVGRQLISHQAEIDAGALRDPEFNLKDLL